MTLTQLGYLVWVYKLKSFSKAAKASFVTQPTLSGQIIKLENYLGVQIFDRDSGEITPTVIGQKIINQAMVIINESKKIQEIIDEEKNILSGELQVGIIPSIAGSLIPLFLKDFHTRYPNIKLKISELKTSELIEKIKNEKIDVGIAATPLKEQNIQENPLYFEPFSIYLPKGHKLLDKKNINIHDIDIKELLMMSDGNCFKDQVSDFCRLKEKSGIEKNIAFESSSFDTLIQLVDNGLGITILPQLNINNMRLQSCKDRIRHFAKEIPSREVSLISKKSALKERLVRALGDSVRNCIPEELTLKMKKSIILAPITYKSDI